MSPNSSTSSVQSDDFRRLKRFGQHLEQAVHDARHESDSGITVVHFWDNDSLFIPTFGFEELKRLRSYLSGGLDQRDDLLTHALFAAGYLGTVSMLAPHRVEYFNTIERRVADPYPGSFSERLSSFLDERPDELDQFNRLADALRSLTSQGDRSNIENAISLVRQMDPWTFVLMESTTSPWPQRLRRILGPQKLVDISVADLPSSAEVMSDPVFSFIQAGLARYGGRWRSVALAIDAAALASLSIMVRNLTEPAANVYPRFYTSSSRIRNLYHNEEWFRELLRFKISSDGGKVRTGTVWRDSYYYQLRVRFPALRPKSVKGGSGVGLSLAELEALSARINRAVIAGEAEMGKLLTATVLPDERTLLHAIRDLEDLGMADVWFGSEPEDYAQSWRAGLKAIEELSTADLTDECVASAFTSLGNQANESIERYRVQMDLILAVARSLDLSRRDGWDDEIGAVKNLGLERWGLSPENAWPFPSELSGSPDGARALLSWTELSELLGSSERLELALGILLSIDEFELAGRLVSLYRGKSSPRLIVMSLACKVRGPAFRRDELLSDFVDELMNLWDVLSEDERFVLALGVGYVAFHAWRKSSFAIRIDRPSDPKGWARFASGVVRANLERYERDMLVLAINHIVYVESAAGLDSPDLPLLVAELRVQASQTGNYRFFDTLGWRNYLLLLREGGAAHQRLDRNILKRMQLCLSDLERAASIAYRDHEVAEHMHAVLSDFQRMQLTVEEAARPQRKRAGDESGKPPHSS